MRILLLPSLLFLVRLVTALQTTPPLHHQSATGQQLSPEADAICQDGSFPSATTVHDGIKVVKETLYLPPTRPSAKANYVNNNSKAPTSDPPTRPSANILTSLKSIYTVLFYGIHHPLLALYTYLPLLAKGMYNTVLYYFFYSLYYLLYSLLFYVLVPILSTTASVFLWFAHPFVKMYEIVMYFAPIWTTVLSSIAMGTVLGSVAGYFTAQSTKDLLVGIVQAGTAKTKTLQGIVQGEIGWREVLSMLGVGIVGRSSGGRKWKDWGTGFRLGGYSTSSLEKARYEFTNKGKTGPGMDMSDQRGYLEPPISYSSSANSSDSRFPMLGGPYGPSFTSDLRKGPNKETVNWDLTGSPSDGGLRSQEGRGNYYQQDVEVYEHEDDEDTGDTISASNGGRSGERKERERGRRSGGMRYLY